MIVLAARILTSIFLICAVSACIADTATLDEVASTSAALVLTDPKGRRWERGQKAVVATAAQEAAYFKSLPALMYQSAYEQGQAHLAGESIAKGKIDLDALAEQLRGKRIENGYEYVSEPDYESAKRILAGAFENFGTPASEVVREGEPTSEEMEGMVDGVFGADNRSARRDNSTYPYSAQIFLSNEDGESACTATLVGPSTAVSAGHCFHNGAAWLSWRGWAPGVDSRDANPFTYDPTPSAACATYPHTCSAGRIVGCYRVTLPNGFVPASSTDYAVIEFHKPWWNGAGHVCNQDYWTMSDNPGSAVGWFGAWVETDAEIENPNVGLYIYGYPYGAPFGNCLGGSCFRPTIWGMGLQQHGANATGSQIRHTLDTTQGQSGSAIYHIATHNGTTMRWVLGVETHYYWREDCALWSCDVTRYNVARRMDSTFASFMLANSDL